MFSVETGANVSTAYSFIVDIAVPAQTNRFSSFSLFQASEIQFKVLVIEVDGRDS